MRLDCSLILDMLSWKLYLLDCLLFASDYYAVHRLLKLLVSAIFSELKIMITSRRGFQQESRLGMYLMQWNSFFNSSGMKNIASRRILRYATSGIESLIQTDFAREECKILSSSEDAQIACSNEFFIRNSYQITVFQWCKLLSWLANDRSHFKLMRHDDAASDGCRNDLPGPMNGRNCSTRNRKWWWWKAGETFSTLFAECWYSFSNINSTFCNPFDNYLCQALGQAWNTFDNPVETEWPLVLLINYGQTSRAQLNFIPFWPTLLQMNPQEQLDWTEQPTEWVSPGPHRRQAAGRRADLISIKSNDQVEMMAKTVSSGNSQRIHSTIPEFTCNNSCRSLLSALLD